MRIPIIPRRSLLEPGSVPTHAHCPWAPLIHVRPLVESQLYSARTPPMCLASGQLLKNFVSLIYATLWESSIKSIYFYKRLYFIRRQKPLFNFSSRISATKLSIRIVQQNYNWYFTSLDTSDFFLDEKFPFFQKFYSFVNPSALTCIIFVTWLLSNVFSQSLYPLILHKFSFTNLKFHALTKNVLSKVWFFYLLVLKNLNKILFY